MNRRRFLEMLVGGAFGAAATATLDVDRLLWMPGVRTFFLPTEPELFVTPEWVVREALRVLQQHLTFANSISRSYDTEFGSRVGQTVMVRIPPRFAAQGIAL